MRLKFIAFLFIAGMTALLWTCGEMSGGKDRKVPDPAHNSKNSLTWMGNYEGVLPCADCAGIETEIELRENGTFELARTYLDRLDSTIVEEGRFEWLENGGTIVLKGSSEKWYYKVVENGLLVLDQNGKKIRGGLSEDYSLKKVE